MCPRLGHARFTKLRHRVRLRRLLRRVVLPGQRVPHPDARFLVSRFSSAHDRKHRVSVHRARRCVRANDVPCIPPAPVLRAHARLELGQGVRPQGHLVLAAVRAALRVGRDSAMSHAASKKDR